MTLTYPFWLEPVVLIVTVLIFIAGMAMSTYLTRNK